MQLTSAVRLYESVSFSSSSFSSSSSSSDGGPVKTTFHSSSSASQDDPSGHVAMSSEVDKPVDSNDITVNVMQDIDGEI